MNSLCCVHLQLNHVVAFLVSLKRAFSATQLGVDFLQTSVDKLFGANGNFVLIFVSLTVVAYGELTQIVDRTLRNFISQHHLCDGGGFEVGLTDSAFTYFIAIYLGATIVTLIVAPSAMGATCELAFKVMVPTRVLMRAGSPLSVFSISYTVFSVSSKAEAVYWPFTLYSLPSRVMTNLMG